MVGVTYSVRKLSVQFEQGALDLAFAEIFVPEQVEKSDEMEDLGNLFLEFVDVEMKPGDAELENVRNLWDLAVCHHDRVADFLPHIDDIEWLDLEKVAPLPPGGRGDAAFILETGQPVSEGLCH